MEELSAFAEELRERGIDAEYLDQDAVRRELDSPTYIGGLWQRTGNAIVDPAQLAWGLAGSRRAGRAHPRAQPVTALAETPGGVELTRSARPAARRAASCWRPTASRRWCGRSAATWCRSTTTCWSPSRSSAEQRTRSAGATGRARATAANQFHYYRLTEDDRILWGGYDAVYHYGNAVAPRLEDRDATYSLLSEHFFETFPQLEGLRFTHRWAGVIDTCSRFCVMWGTALSRQGGVRGRLHRPRVSRRRRFGARVALDLVDGLDTERTRLRFVRSKPLPFPPEPLRWAGIQLTRRALDRADRNQGRRGLWLRALDRVGLGFD